MEQYVKGFKGFTPVKMCGLSPLASFYYISNKCFFCLKNKLKIPNRPHTSNNCSELRKSYKQHGYLDKNNSRHTVNFLDVSRHTLNPIDTLFYRKSELQMFLLISGGHIGAPKRYTNMAPYKALQRRVKRFGK